MIKSNKILKQVSTVGLIILMLFFLSYLLVRNNIHTVKSGVLYRSAQLSPPSLKRLIREKRIRTIINLRGANSAFDWYQDELSVSRVMGVQHYDIRLSATRLLKPAQLKRLIELFQTAPKPILVHCQGGADRTGFASSMWLLMHDHSLSDAKRAFSIAYFVYRQDSLGKEVLPLYVNWLRRNHYKTNSKHFMEWAASTKLGNTQ